MANELSLATRAFLAALGANGPHPAYREPLMLFGQFVGVWDMDVRFFDAAGTVLFHEPGEWTFGWVLDGRALQDVLTYASVDAAGATIYGQRRTGSSLRHYHPETGTWRVVWLGATSGTLLFLEGGRVGDEIWLEGKEGDSDLLRWMFTDIGNDQFQWKGMISSDGGTSWRMEQEMRARRRSSSFGS